MAIILADDDQDAGDLLDEGEDEDSGGMSRAILLPGDDPAIDAMIGNEDRHNPPTIFGRLTRGQTRGISINLLTDSSAPDKRITNTNNAVLNVGSEDAYASQLVITLLPPQVIAISQIDGYTADGFNLAAQSDFRGTNQVITGVAMPVIIGRLSWGIGGANVEDVEVDLSNGATINLQASWVRLRAAIESFTNAPNTPAVYRVSGFVGPGQARGPSCTRTMATAPVGTDHAAAIVAATQSAIRPVPQFAATAQLLAASAQVPNYELRFFRDSAGASEVARYLYTAAINGEVKVPAGAFYFAIFNGAGANAALIVVFTLSL